ncbi:MAG: hypothetical protein K1X85_04905 [Ignavibacteria bacterium]|nr:hypothetical protein [Ignavibacteria bacterium]
MNAAHFHLIINHFPVIGTIITMFLLFIGILKKSDDVKKAAMLVLILTAVVTIPVYVSGDGAQEMIEGNYDDVDEQYIDQHEDFALYSFIAMDIVGALAILSMFLYRKPKEISNSFAVLMFALVLAVNGMMAYTANLGGKIHHPEIRSDAGQNDSSGESDDQGKENEGKKEKEDDKDEH